MAIVPESLRRIAGLHRHASCRPSQPALRSLNQDPPPEPHRGHGQTKGLRVNDVTSRSTCRNGATSIATPSVVASVLRIGLGDGCGGVLEVHHEGFRPGLPKPRTWATDSSRRRAAKIERVAIWAKATWRKPWLKKHVGSTKNELHRRAVRAKA
uniref:Uncharacterized protein n=1 Tax=Oryza glumipatula TaxID=40148 RepID=A0A0D9ZIH7_9ORYZ